MRMAYVKDVSVVNKNATHGTANAVRETSMRKTDASNIDYRLHFFATFLI